LHGSCAATPRIPVARLMLGSQGIRELFEKWLGNAKIEVEWAN
jgi:hypothetical protein